MKHALFLSIAALAVTTATGLAVAQGDTAGRRFTIQLKGTAEIPGPGDPDGTGTAVININPGQNRVCFESTVQNIDLPATLAHIHRGVATAAGPPVVDFSPFLGDGATNEGCVENVSRDLIREIITNPAGFYFNEHNTPFPAGAVRGQLSRRPN